MSKDESARDQFSRWKQAGYEIQLVGVTIDPQQAKERTVIRGKKSGRWVPSSALVEAHRGFNANIKSYFDAVDKVYFYDNTLAARQIIAKKLNLPEKLRLPTPNCGVLLIEERIVESLLGKSRLFQKGFKFHESGLGRGTGGENRGGQPAKRGIKSEGCGSGSESAGGLPGEEKGPVRQLNAGRRASGGDQLNLGLYRNQGEFDFTDQGKAPGDLVKKNMGLATTIATDYRNIPGVNLDDVIQQARVAFVKAARAYPQQERAMPFKDYAGRSIRNELNTLYGRQSRIARNESVFLDEPVTEDGLSRHELVPDMAPDRTLLIERQETWVILTEILDGLPERPRAIVRGFMAGRSTEDMAPEMGITRQMVHRTLRGTLTVMRQRLRERGFDGQDEGILFAGDRGEDNSTEDLFAELNRDLPSQAEVDALRKQAAAEPAGQRTIDQPQKANYAEHDAYARGNQCRAGHAGASPEARGKKRVDCRCSEAHRNRQGGCQARDFGKSPEPDQVRTFAARRDPFKTPAERHLEFLT